MRELERARSADAGQHERGLNSLVHRGLECRHLGLQCRYVRLLPVPAQRRRLAVALHPLQPLLFEGIAAAVALAPLALAFVTLSVRHVGAAVVCGARHERLEAQLRHHLQIGEGGDHLQLLERGGDGAARVRASRGALLLEGVVLTLQLMHRGLERRHLGLQRLYVRQLPIPVALHPLPA
eukprot:scaffold82364_cov36-Phaeocystis_antarctica.AAC.1